MNKAMTRLQKQKQRKEHVWHKDKINFLALFETCANLQESLKRPTTFCVYAFSLSTVEKLWINIFYINCSCICSVGQAEALALPTAANLT